MIRFEHVTFTHHGAAAPTLVDVDLTIEEGELVVVVGRTGSGKSTLLRAINGLVPHFTGGRLEGRVRVAGRDTAAHRPRDLADLVGFVVQDPVSGFVAGTVEDELAWSMESLGVDGATMRRRVEETLDLLALAPLRDRPLESLSGGERQRVAIGAALTTHPPVLVLDEPTSALDPGAAEEVLAALHRLVHDLGVTVVLAEHRLERIVQYADRVLALPGDGRPPLIGPPGPVLAATDVAPPVVELAAVAGWEPPPVSVRDARRRATDLRAELAGTRPPVPLVVGGDPLLAARDVSVAHGAVRAVRRVDLAVAPGERVAVMGRNGAGKTSLLWALQGSGRRSGGTVAVTGADPAARPARDRRALVGLVPQEPADLLYLETVAAELAQADHETGAVPGTARAHLDRLVPGVPDGLHPRDLSEGQRLGLALAITLAGTPPVLLLDEPTRGLDPPAKRALAAALADLGRDRAVLLATHDVEFVAAVATRVVLLADGEVVADGPADEVVTSSPVFAPQVAKVLAPLPYLTVDQVRAGLAAEVPR